MFTVNFRRRKGDPLTILDPGAGFTVINNLDVDSLKTLRSNSILRFSVKEPLKATPASKIPTGADVICTCDNMHLIDNLLAERVQSSKGKGKKNASSS